MHVECGTCGASMTLEAHLRTATCPYCASPSVVERPAMANRPPPSFTLGFGVAHDAACAAVRRWQKSRGIFTRSGVKTAGIESVKGLYVPAYLYTSIAHSSYQAEIGENYQETETYTTTDSKGNTVVRTRTVTKTEWRPLHGQHSSYIMDVLVTASRGISNDELELVEPFDMKALRRYTPALLSGWIAEDPTMTMEECIALARGESYAKVSSALSAFMPGDSHRSLQHQTQFERETIDLVHVPLWVLAVKHDPAKPPVRLIVNGQTAKVWGKAPLSWIKITIAIALVLGVIGIVVAIVHFAGAGSDDVTPRPAHAVSPAPAAAPPTSLQSTPPTTSPGAGAAVTAKPRSSSPGTPPPPVPVPGGQAKNTPTTKTAPTAPGGAAGKGSTTAPTTGPTTPKPGAPAAKPAPAAPASSKGASPAAKPPGGAR